MRKVDQALSAQTCRDIVFSELRMRGPLSVFEMLTALQEVFPKSGIHWAYLCSALCVKNSGISVVDGVIIFTVDIKSFHVIPLSRHEANRVMAGTPKRKRVVEMRKHA